jgi:hypothetical protein
VTLPNGPDGVNTDYLFLTSANGHGNQSVADLVGNDQATVTDAYKQKYVANGSSVFSNATGPFGKIFGALTGGIPGLILSLLGEIGSAVADLGNLVTDAWAQIQNIGGLIVQVIQGLEDTPLLDPLDLLGAVWFWVGGLWNTVLQSVSKQNPAVVAQDNRIAALEATWRLAVAQPGWTTSTTPPSRNGVLSGRSRRFRPDRATSRRAAHSVPGSSLHQTPTPASTRCRPPWSIWATAVPG